MKLKALKDTFARLNSFDKEKTEVKAGETIEVDNFERYEFLKRSGHFKALETTDLQDKDQKNLRKKDFEDEKQKVLDEKKSTENLDAKKVTTVDNANVKNPNPEDPKPNDKAKGEKPLTK